MSTRSNGLELLSPEEITRREKMAKQLLRETFKKTPALKRWIGYIDIGLDRLTEQAALARTMAHHMKRRGITTISELADKVDLDAESPDLMEICVPPAFRSPKTDTQRLITLFWLCDLEWDKGARSFKPIATERPA